MSRITPYSAAVVQAGSLIYDTPATLTKLQDLTLDAARRGAKLVVFPEAFVGGYPKGLDFGARLGTRSDEGREEFRRYYEGAIEEGGPESDIMAAAARSNGVHLVVGVIERAGGTLYCSAFFYGPDGSFLGKHRKLMPTALERLVWGFGDGSTLPVMETALGKIGAVICWENYMPLLRTAMYAQGVQVYCAPTVDARDTWLPTMQTIALEGRCFVVSACQFTTAADFPADHQARSADGSNAVLIRGGSCIVDPLGKVLVAPSFEGEGIYLAELDLDSITRGKYDLDVVGHYARPDVFQLRVNRASQSPVSFLDPAGEQGTPQILSPSV
ncbi:carbon-nitrogen hydrolase family protein [Burkholderia vietnamiensis]|uniref:carbon-nitrogen hydrolase family protein n=1 Tax=Burkholderia vietnamiensis TaxID=60552 RepID=UPI001D1428FB|nr:carbon-nitrogen hydrolase family protein [Burkholderia vietnamiensis]UEC01749.1 carbon-nitrogen hydrolase family protein [Burkholderia vietnamiensis]